MPVHLSVDGAPPERILAGMVSGNYFQVLGVRSFRGRLLSPGDDAGAAPPVVALSHGLWQRRFAGDPGILGRTVLLNGTGFTVAGVAPPGFTGVDPGRGEEIWLPLAWAATADPAMRSQLPYRSSSFFHLVGRLRPGASPASALTQLETVSSRQRAIGPANPEEEGFEEPWPRVVPLAATIHPEGIRLSWLLLGTVLLVLLAACADVAGYLLARSERDQRQVAVRLALGATRVRIVRQLLAEGLLFAGAGALGGLLLGGWVARLLVRMAPPRLPIPLNPDLDVLDPRILAFTAAVSLVAGMLVALAPAWRAMSTNLYLVLKSEVATVGLGSARVPLRNLLVVLQVAASVVLLSGAGLLVRTLFNIAAMDPGFEPERVLAASVDVARQGYEKAAGQSVLERLHEAAARIPAVRAAALSTQGPLPPSQTMSLTPPGSDQEVWVGHALVSPGYFRTLGIEIRRGRDFTPQDRAGAPGAAIVNRAMAERFWPGLDPVGQRLPAVGPEEITVEIVGVVADIRNRG
ncbi:MAG: ABC transporter permease, partial [Thermoanaerobaculia bacterium]